MRGWVSRNTHAICTYFPRVYAYVSISLDSLNSSRVLVAPIVIIKIERNTKARESVPSIYFWRINESLCGGCTKEFRCVTEGENRDARMEAWKHLACEYCCTPTNLTWIGDRSLRPFEPHSAPSSVHSEFNFELGNQTSVFQLHPPLVTHSSDNSKSLQGSKLANNRLSIKA